MMSGPKTMYQNQTMSVDDDAVKKNTDCVYFLASPLTCKKGSECEYRHSEHARVNPRDCWYWLNDSCLNPKCAFRHPPLDGLLGSQSAAQAAKPSSLAAHQSKQPVPCIFFQRGLCLKGDKCAFLHGPNSVTTKHPQVAPPAAAEITGPKTVFGIQQRSAQEPKIYQPNISYSNTFTDVKPDPKMSNPRSKSDAVKRVVLPSRGFNDRSPINKSSTIAPFSNGMHQVEIPEDYIMPNVKDGDDLYRESSPGFDVLVDDELADDQYYDVNQYSTREDHEVRNVDADPEMLHDPQVYNVHEGIVSQQSRYENKRSSDRTSRGTDSLERWNFRNGVNFERLGQSDLRNRLKLKKESRTRSVVNNNYHERRSGDYRRESRPLAPLESSLSNRLQSRIKDPRRSPMRGTVSGSDPGTQIHERIGSRVQDDLRSERNTRGQGEFSGPKRLSDLKSCKSSVKDRLISGQESFSLGKRKNNGENEQNSDLSFEGPKPLSEILKRKKRSEAIAPMSGLPENKETDKTESTMNADINKEAYTSVTDASEKEIELDNIHPSENTKTNHNEQDEGIITGEETEDQNLEEGYEQGEDGEEYYYYEEDEGEYNIEEGENVDGGEYVKNEDEHVFEKEE